MRLLPQPMKLRGSFFLFKLIRFGLLLTIALVGINQDEMAFESSHLLSSRATAPQQSGVFDLPYELVPIMEALETGRLSGQVANTLSIGQLMHQDTFRRLIKDIKLRRNMPDTAESLRETLDVLLREATEVRNIATHQLLVFDRKSGNMVIISMVYTALLENGFRGYGVVLPSTHWGYLPPFAREATQADWYRAKDARVSRGRWSGAYKLEDKQILLPGFQALDLLSKPLNTGDSVSQIDVSALNLQEVSWRSE